MNEKEFYRRVRIDMEEYAKAKLNAQILEKETSLIMKILSWILFFNRNFMSDYVTTLGNRIYFPVSVLRNDKAFVQVLAHEMVHLQDGKGWKYPLFVAGYLFPQILALLSVFAFVHSWWWLLCLVFLAPIPAPFRAYLELRGYTMTLIMIHLGFEVRSLKQTQEDRKATLDFITQQFTTSAYYFMWPFPHDTYDTLEKTSLETIQSLEAQWKSEKEIQPQDELALYIIQIMDKHRPSLNMPLN